MHITPCPLPVSAFRCVAAIAVAFTVMVLGGSVAGAGQQVTVQGEHVSAGPGGAVTLEVSGHSQEPIGAFGIDVKFDPEMLTPVSCQSDTMLCTKGVYEGQLRINGISLIGYSGDITFGTIVFSAAQDPGVVPVDVDVTVISGLELNDLSGNLSVSDGSVTIDEAIEPRPVGDANCDNRVTAADSIALLMALGGEEDAECQGIADVNCDDRVDLNDVLDILRALGGLLVETEASCIAISTS